MRDGRFEVHGLDPDAEVPIYFLEPKGKLGATVRLSGKSGSGGPVTVRLEPCGTARARLVDPTGKPVARVSLSHGSRWSSRPGPIDRDRNQPAEAARRRSRPARGSTRSTTRDGPVSDAEGRIAFPALIPGATYSVHRRSPRRPAPFRKDFTVKPGETVDLGDIPIEKPPG